MTDTTVTKMHLVCPHCNATNRVPSDKLQAELNCGKCHQPLLTAHPDNLAEVAFNAQLSKSELPMVVDFWAPWCGPCRMMAPAYEKVSQDMQGKARFVKVNTEDEQGLAAKYNIRSIPTLAVFAGGREIARQPGAMSAPDLARWVSAALQKR
jgi:thioredoxin 2